MIYMTTCLHACRNQVKIHKSYSVIRLPKSHSL